MMFNNLCYLNSGYSVQKDKSSSGVVTHYPLLVSSRSSIIYASCQQEFLYSMIDLQENRQTREYILST